MNTEIILELQKEISDLSLEVKSMSKYINSLKIDDQRRLNANIPIPPGIACKVAYDKNGLIIKGIGLELSDIPQLDIDKIKNLKKSLDDKANTKDFIKFKVDVNEMIKPAVSENNTVVGTGVKVNYTKDGRIVSTSELLPSDIPSIDISKIEGLSEILDNFKINMLSIDNNDKVSTIKTSAGTFTKVTIDKYGRVITGEKIGIDDIPIEIISKLNSIESQLSNFASSYSVEIMGKDLVNKLDANKSITSGTFTKVHVDSKGLITKGENLTIRDLPEISINDIKDLNKTLRNKANETDLLDLQNTVVSLTNSLSKVGEITGIKNELNTKADDETVVILQSKVNSMKNTLDSLVNRTTSDMLNEHLLQIEENISNLEARFSVIEKVILNHENIK